MKSTEEKEQVSTGYNKGLHVMGIVLTTKETHDPRWLGPATFKQNKDMMRSML